MNYKMYVSLIMGLLSITAFDKNADGVMSLTDDQKKALEAEGFKADFVDGFNAALAKDFADENSADGTASETNEGTDQQEEILDVDAMKALALDLIAKNAELAKLNEDKSANTETIAALKKEIGELKEKVTKLTNAPEDDPGAGVQHQTGNMPEKLDYLNKDQLLGLAGSMYALKDRPYNQRARAAIMVANGHEVYLPKAQSAKVDYAMLEQDLGEYYRTQKRKELQSFLTKLSSVESIFPLESGVQDREIITNIFLGEFSQADSSNDSDFDKVVKGKYEIQPEEIRMYDVMLAYEFKALKKLEKQWIGYLNKEGSNSIKTSFIEYLLQETAKKLHNEREQRRMKGVRKNPDVNVPGRAMDAADGYFRYISNKINGLQIKPFELGEITPANIGEKIFEGTRQIPQELIDRGDMVLYMPSAMIVEYHKYNELHYGTNQDYKANSMFVKEYPDVKIVELKNAGNHRRLVWTIEGNIKTFEHEPGEMLDFRLNIKEWSVTVTSQWKEGLAAVLVGKKWERAQDMDFNHQFIFASDTDLAGTEFLPMGQDEATPSALHHKSLVSVPNTAVVAITDIIDTEVGDIVTLKNGSDDKGIKITKADKFSTISADWTPEMNDTITLMKRQDGKWIELSRKSAGLGVLQFDADATTPSVAGGTEFQVGTNTKTTAITNLADAVVNTKYTIHGNGTGDNVTTIANSGNFSLTAAITLSTGKFITVVKASDGKFYEVARG